MNKWKLKGAVCLENTELLFQQDHLIYYLHCHLCCKNYVCISSQATTAKCVYLSQIILQCCTTGLDYEKNWKSMQLMSDWGHANVGLGLGLERSRRLHVMCFSSLIVPVIKRHWLLDKEMSFRSFTRLQYLNEI